MIKIKKKIEANIRTIDNRHCHSECNYMKYNTFELMCCMAFRYEDEAGEESLDYDFNLKDRFGFPAYLRTERCVDTFGIK